MKRELPRNATEFEKQIIEHPAKMYFRMKMGLLAEIYENSEDMIDALKWVAEGIADLSICILIALAHILTIPIYPAVKLMRFMRFRQRIIQNPGRLRISVEPDSADDQ